MTTDPLAPWRHKLRQERAALLAEGEASRDDRRPVELDQASVGRLSRMDAMQRQAMAAAQQARRAGRLKAIDAALARIDSAEFGWCESCGDEIAPARLDIDPTLRRCCDCARG